MSICYCRSMPPLSPGLYRKCTQRHAQKIHDCTEIWQNNYLSTSNTSQRTQENSNGPSSSADSISQSHIFQAPKMTFQKKTNQQTKVGSFKLSTKSGHVLPHGPNIQNTLCIIQPHSLHHSGVYWANNHLFT